MSTFTQRQIAVDEHRAWRVRLARTVVDYRRYAAFSWQWSWRRCVIFVAFGCLLSVQAGISWGRLVESRHIGIAAGLITAVTMIVAVCVGPCAAAWIRARGWPVARELAGVIAAVILGVAAASVCQWLANRYINALELRQDPARLAGATRFLVHMDDIANSPVSLLTRNFIFLFLSGAFALPSYLAEQRRLIEEARDREFGELQLQKRETDLRLLVLQAQIEPHFLFNTLASLRSLLRQDVDRAETMIDALVEHLRAAMPVFRENKQPTTLSDQLRICRSYLELMRVRLPDRLTYTIAVPDAIRNVPFPPLVLLTLVENAVKHGIEPKPGPGLICIDARREQRTDGFHISVSVTDNGAGLSAGLGHGVGLSNIRAQLALKYGDHAALSLMSAAGGGAVASVNIPESPAYESHFPVEESTSS